MQFVEFEAENSLNLRAFFSPVNSVLLAKYVLPKSNRTHVISYVFGTGVSLSYLLVDSIDLISTTRMFCD